MARHADTRQRPAASAAVIGRIRARTVVASRAIRRIAFRGQLGPVGGAGEDRSGWRR